MANLGFLQDSALQHPTLVEFLLTKLGQHGFHCDLLSHVKISVPGWINYLMY